eukprot:3881835-Rhodomonas_salina.1
MSGDSPPLILPMKLNVRLLHCPPPSFSVTGRAIQIIDFLTVALFVGLQILEQLSQLPAPTASTAPPPPSQKRLNQQQQHLREDVGHGCPQRAEHVGSETCSPHTRLSAQRTQRSSRTEHGGGCRAQRGEEGR